MDRAQLYIELSKRERFQGSCQGQGDDRIISLVFFIELNVNYMCKVFFFLFFLKDKDALHIHRLFFLSLINSSECKRGDR